METVFTTIIGILAVATKKLWSRGKFELEEQQLLKNGVVVILHDRLFQACTYHLEIGWCSINEMKNIGKLYKSYHELGGNGTGTEVYLRVCKLPTIDENRNQEKEF